MIRESISQVLRNVPIDSLLKLRAAAAILVVFWHCGGYDTENVILRMLGLSGRCCVWLFFILSGYVMGYGFFSGKHKSDIQGISVFYRKRFFRVYPLFALILIISYLMFLFKGEVVSFGDLFRQIFPYQLNHKFSLNGVFWTLGVELQFYLIVPFIALCISKSKNGLLMAIGLYIAGVVIWEVRGLRDDRSMPGNFMHFMVGITLARVNFTRWWREFTPPPGVLFRYCLLGSGVISLVLSNYFYFYHPGIFWRGGGPFLVNLAGSLIILEHIVATKSTYQKGDEAHAGIHHKIENDVKVKGFQQMIFLSFNRALGFIGVISYGVYGWHGFLMLHWKGLVNAPIKTLFLSILVAWISFITFEKYFQRFGLRKSRHAGTRH